MTSHKTNKSIRVLLILVVLALCITGCQNKNGNLGQEQPENTRDAYESTTSETVTSEGKIPDDTKQVISLRSCELAKHPVSGNPGFYEIDCKEYFEDLKCDQWGRGKVV
ncbi:MAG: hypothetical protein ACI4EK_08880 [Wujia sp.]